MTVLEALIHDPVERQHLRSGQPHHHRHLLHQRRSTGRIYRAPLLGLMEIVGFGCLPIFFLCVVLAQLFRLRLKDSPAFFKREF